MRPIALVTCEKLPELHEDDRLLLPALKARGLDPRPAVWSDPAVDWSAFEAAVVRSAWDYYGRVGEFREWTRKLEAARVPLWNPPALLRWNSDKVYLRDLEKRGVPVVPTAWMKGEGASLAETIARAGWRRAVIKPSVSADAKRTFRIDAVDAGRHEKAAAEVLRDSELMVQPYLEAVETEGEWSFVFLGGRLSHTALKRPAPGDFRVQESRGGTNALASPPRELVARAEAVLRAVPETLLYARVDMVRWEGELVLSELEILEPSLYLKLDPGAPGRFADALSELTTER